MCCLQDGFAGFFAGVSVQVDVSVVTMIMKPRAHWLIGRVGVAHFPSGMATATPRVSHGLAWLALTSGPFGTQKGGESGKVGRFVFAFSVLKSRTKNINSFLLAQRSSRSLAALVVVSARAPVCFPPGQAVNLSAMLPSRANTYCRGRIQRCCKCCSYRLSTRTSYAN